MGQTNKVVVLGYSGCGALAGRMLKKLQPSLDVTIKHIDLITVAIRSGLNVLDLTTLRCAGQPELSPDPGMEPISLAAENVFGQLY